METFNAKAIGCNQILMDSQDAKAIGCNRILQLSKEKTEFFFASRSRSAVTTAGCSIFLVFCTLTIFKKLGGGTQMWIFMKKAQQRSSFSWSRREVYMMIWLWYDVCIYIYITIYITLHITWCFNHFDHQTQVSFWWWRSCPLPWLWSRCPRHCFGSEPQRKIHLWKVVS